MLGCAAGDRRSERLLGGGGAEGMFAGQGRKPLKKRGAVLGDGNYKQKRTQNKVGRALFAVGACHM